MLLLEFGASTELISYLKMLEVIGMKQKANMDYTNYSPRSLYNESITSILDSSRCLQNAHLYPSIFHGEWPTSQK